MMQKPEDIAYPTVGERLEIQHRDQHQISIETEIVEFRHLELAICRARITTPKGVFTGSGAASQEKDPDMVTSLLEIAETRAVARALRFSGAIVNRTSREEMPRPVHGHTRSGKQSSISEGQKNAIQRISNDNGWNIIEAVRRITRKNIESLGALSQEEANAVLQRMKSAKAA